MFYICKFHDKTDDATRYTKCWLNFLLKCYTNAFVSADAQIAEWRSQTTAHLKGECFPKLYKKSAGKSETHSKRTQRYKKSTFTVCTRWIKIFCMFYTCSVFVDLLSNVLSSFAVGFWFPSRFFTKLWEAFSFQMSGSLTSLFRYLCVSWHECICVAF